MNSLNLSLLFFWKKCLRLDELKKAIGVEKIMTGVY